MSSANTQQSPSDIAIVICTYNPDEQTFSRTLKAVESLKIPHFLKIECVVVDNNSSTSISELSYVQSFLKNCTWAKLITEYNQGLTFARIAGVISTTAPIIIFFDDDNEPTQDYLQIVNNCLEEHRCIAALGPGKIHVEFLEPVSDWFKKNFSGYFQERNAEYTEYGCLIGKWTDFYPFGTGLVVKREVFEKYYENFQAGKLNSTDRKGNSLSSGGDIQIVWQAVNMGLAAGICSELNIKHLIPKKRSNLQYIKRLRFGTAASYLPALLSSFPAQKEKALVAIPSDRQILHDIVNLILRRSLKFKYKILIIDLAHYLGGVVGTLQAIGCCERHWIYKVVKLLRLE